MIIKMLIGAAVITGVFGGILFLSAGRTDWTEAWIVTAFYGAYLLSSMIWGAIHAPDLMRERSHMARNVKAWDKVLNLLYTLFLIALLIVAGLDRRYGWSQLPLMLQWLGRTGIVCSSYVTWLTMKENAYLSRWARIQDDRGQKVISSGPYRYVRHPMYASVLVFVVCITFALDSLWALIPAGLVIAVFILRTRFEDAMLHEELNGYREYAEQTRFRLIPGLW